MDDESKIPLKWVGVGIGAAFAVLVSTIAVTVHVATIEATANAAIEGTKFDQQMRQKIWDELRNIDNRLSNIEGKLNK